MPGFNPYENLLRNFSKHKFKMFVEKTILNPDIHSHEQLAEYGGDNEE